jgi:anti-sigma factor RsiW
LSEYIDGGLSPELCQELEKHLEGCDNCRVVLNTTRRTIDLVHTPMEKPDLPDDVRERLFKRLNLDDYFTQKS